LWITIYAILLQAPYVCEASALCLVNKGPFKNDVTRLGGRGVGQKGD